MRVRRFLANFRSFGKMAERNPKCMAITRETFNVWERRAPFAPRHVKKLIESGVKVLIQPSSRRAYTVEEYESVGAIVSEDVTEANLIIGVKSIPIESLVPNRTYCFYSHTIKAQQDNMPLLDALLEKNIQQIDYEPMLSATGQSLVMSSSSKFAGRVGMLDILNGFGLRLLALGFNTPFLNISLAHNYRTMAEANESLRKVSADLAKNPLPAEMCPLVLVLTGSGNVSQGCQDILRQLPHDYVTVDELPRVTSNGARNKLYVCIVEREDHLVRKDGGQFTVEDYGRHPECYDSVFATKVAPYTSILINCIIWMPNQPRFLTNDNIKDLLAVKEDPNYKTGMGRVPYRLLSICDISADPGGSLEFMTDCTTIDKPFYIHRENPTAQTDRFDVPDGVLICSVDNMPAQMAYEATSDFGDMLLPFAADMLKCNANEPFDKLDTSTVIRNAMITSNGKLTPKYEYITELRKKKGV